MRLTLSQSQDQSIRNQPSDQPISSLQEEICEYEWSFCPRNEPPSMTANVIRMKIDPLKRMAVTQVQDIKSCFELFIPDNIQIIMLDCTNLEESRVFGEKWKENSQNQLQELFWSGQ